jgi:iron complex outermembrane receptor protein
MNATGFVLLLSLLASAGAVAQTADNKALEEIVVTAQRRAERLQDVPSAITALDAEALSRLALRGNEDLSGQVPSMTFNVLTPGENTITMRGLGTAYGLSPTVSYYLNEVPLDMRTDGYSGTPDIDLFDVDRIEVLRGPQGTLYGASAMGGAIRIITKQPEFDELTSDSEMGLETTDGGNEGWQARSALNVPLSERFATRLVGTYQRVPGYIDRREPVSSFYDPNPDDPIADENANDVDIYGGRLIAKWLASDDVTVTPSVLYQEINADGQADYYTNQPEFSLASYYPEESETRLIVGNALVEAKLGAMDLLSSTSYTSKDVDLNHDFSVLSSNLAPFFGVPEPIPNYPTSVFDGSDNDGFIQELRLTSAADDASRLRWTVGAYYSKFRQKSAEYIDSAAFGEDIAELFGDPSLADPALYRFDQRTEDEQTAIFGEAVFRLWSAVEITAGLRGYWLETSLENVQSGVFAAPSQPHTSSDKSGINPRLVINYRASEDTIIYATGARGYRPGGPNVGLPANIGCVLGDAYRPLFDPDSVWNYELGV